MIDYGASVSMEGMFSSCSSLKSYDMTFLDWANQGRDDLEFFARLEDALEAQDLFQVKKAKLEQMMKKYKDSELVPFYFPRERDQKRIHKEYPEYSL